MALPPLQNTPINDPVTIPSIVAAVAVGLWWAVLRIQDIRQNRAKKAKSKTDEASVVKPSSNGRVDALTDLLAEKHTNLETCQKALESKTHDYKELQESLDALVAANGELNKQAAALKADKRALETERDGLRLEVAALQTARRPELPEFVETGDDEDTTEVKTKGSE